MVVVAVVGVVLWAAGVRLPRDEPVTRHHVEPRARLHCDATWVGGTRGDWSRAANWSTGAVPDRSTHACIPRGTTAVVSHGRNPVWAVEGGSLDLRGGALLMMGTAVASEIADLRLVKATLGGPGKMMVTRRMYWGWGGSMYGAGTTDLGPASDSVISAGNSSRGAAHLGGDDGTGPHAVTGRSARAPACSRYSPPWALDCATRHPREAREVRRVWARFARAANDAARAGRPADLAPLLDPRTCGVEIERRRGDCRHVAAVALEEIAKRGPFSATLRQVLVEGDEAVAKSRVPISLRFVRAGGAWRVSVI
jgi:hypothetical protein